MAFESNTSVFRQRWLHVVLNLGRTLCDTWFCIPSCFKLRQVSVSLFLRLLQCVQITLWTANPRDEMRCLVLYSKLRAGTGVPAPWAPSLHKNEFSSLQTLGPAFLSTWSALSYILPGCRWGSSSPRPPPVETSHNPFPSTPGPTSPILRRMHHLLLCAL